MKIKILVATHKLANMPKDLDLYLPILVGASRNWHENINFQRDDMGDNISDKNPNYNELTAAYWAWKNLNDVDAIGLVQYRRYLAPKRSVGSANVLRQSQIEKMLTNYDLILPKKRRYYIETNYTHYVHAHHSEPLDQTREIVKEQYPGYLKSFDHVMKMRSAHMFNMFVMKKNIFDNYCEWMFGILNKLEARIDVSQYSSQEARAFGYISELLMDVWVEKNHIKYTETPWIQLGGKHTFRKIFFFVGRKFNIGVRKTHFE
ncbi:DUF4422 domain-containing protein [Secundilactobacillus folii]|uniref:DUF4422 domain-containing protein n=1 Tax=Secundilactobacillus folii TaxID=2678357 RepID=A0A7X3C4A1_9LACO|nr:DUF4422 domain-containing protein [Secundilactobacillus folii]